jgi:hypothetical protein
MWLEKSFGRETSACVVRVAARRQRVRRSFMRVSVYFYTLAVGPVGGAGVEKASGPRMVLRAIEAKMRGLSTARFTIRL